MQPKSCFSVALCSPAKSLTFRLMRNPLVGKQAKSSNTQATCKQSYVSHVAYPANDMFRLGSPKMLRLYPATRVVIVSLYCSTVLSTGYLPQPSGFPAPDAGANWAQHGLASSGLGRTPLKSQLYKGRGSQVARKEDQTETCTNGLGLLAPFTQQTLKGVPFTLHTRQRGSSDTSRGWFPILFNHRSF